MKHKHKPASAALTFETDCVGCGDGQAIYDMVESAEPITRRRFLQLVDRESLNRVASNLGYASRARDGLTMAADWHIAYFLGMWRGRPWVVRHRTHLHGMKRPHYRRRVRFLLELLRNGCHLPEARTLALYLLCYNWSHRERY